MAQNPCLNSQPPLTTQNMALHQQQLQQQQQQQQEMQAYQQYVQQQNYPNLQQQVTPNNEQIYAQPPNLNVRTNQNVPAQQMYYPQQNHEAYPQQDFYAQQPQYSYPTSTHGSQTLMANHHLQQQQTPMILNQNANQRYYQQQYQPPQQQPLQIPQEPSNYYQQQPLSSRRSQPLLQPVVSTENQAEVPKPEYSPSYPLSYHGSSLITPIITGPLDSTNMPHLQEQPLKTPIVPRPVVSRPISSKKAPKDNIVDLLQQNFFPIQEEASPGDKVTAKSASNVAQQEPQNSVGYPAQVEASGRINQQYQMPLTPPLTPPVNYQQQEVGYIPTPQPQMNQQQYAVQNQQVQQQYVPPNQQIMPPKLQMPLNQQMSPNQQSQQQYVPPSQQLQQQYVPPYQVQQQDQRFVPQPQEYVNQNAPKQQYEEYHGYPPQIEKHQRQQLNSVVEGEQDYQNVPFQNQHQVPVAKTSTPMVSQNVPNPESAQQYRYTNRFGR